MIWTISWRCDPQAREIADRHYNRQTHGAANFVPPGRCVVLRSTSPRAFWVTSWPFAQYVRHAWAGAWMCSAFRNESGGEHMKSSEMIRQALAATRFVLGDPPDIGCVTFVNADKVRRKRDPGRCFIRAGFKPCGHTLGGLVALQILPPDMPAPQPPNGLQLAFDDHGGLA